MKKKLILLSLLTLGLGLAAPAHARLCGKGDSAQVLWKGDWYSATVVEAKPESCLVHYKGYNDSWNEWVGADRIKLHGKDKLASYQDGDAVQVLWKDQWWPAHILKVKDDNLYIHYDGFKAEWDEWVGPERYRKAASKQ